MNTPKSIAVCYGDGIGPEIMESTLSICKSAGFKHTIEVITLGKNLYDKGYKTGMSEEAVSVLKRVPVLLKAPLTTVQGEGMRSVNVTLRKMMGLFVNVRPSNNLIFNHSKNINVVVIRENSEDIYSGIEYRNSYDTRTSIKIITEQASYRICDYAFRFAQQNGRKKVSCFVKDNIMKMTDGIFHKMFLEVANHYPDIEKEVLILDIAMANLAKYPERFDVIVTTNLYGDVVSDVCAELSGSIGIAGSVNLGTKYAMFEAVHGSAPKIANKNIANPMGMVNAAIMMLNYLNENHISEKILRAWMQCVKNKWLTRDLVDNPKVALNTQDFTDTMIKCIRDDNKTSVNIDAHSINIPDTMQTDTSDYYSRVSEYIKHRTLVGVDIYVDFTGNLNKILEIINTFDKINGKNVSIDLVPINESIFLNSILSKGMELWPTVLLTNDYTTDYITCRFIASKNINFNNHDITALMNAFEENSVNIVKIETLYISPKRDMGFAN
ncbi:MAG: isocitrate dehydrogenase [Candidatus Xenolissoclinum pacificiensis L6]|uniref:Isocitrate dehydrogenase [NADP] n=1 Tax=Candidatus Xenolissoclinum pacificiensis L6 TaxID=1401685 RepID=W2V1D0_9RICK|nr:MAG: isocitrate dehydrogenase [Candidatus Xenolissoclinum pacificiensis L6]